MVSGSPRMCIAAYGTPRRATVACMFRSSRPPDTSLTRSAPANTACSATLASNVSTEISTPLDRISGSAAAARITGTTRAACGCAETPINLLLLWGDRGRTLAPTA